MAQAPKKTTRKVTTRKSTTAKPEVAAAPKSEKQVNSHIEAGINVSRYTGPSSFVNGNRKPKVMLGRAVDAANLTARAQSGLYALRDCYGNKKFQPRGFDNGILRDLAGAGLITLSGGQKQTIDGKEYMVDGASAVQVTLTAAGMSYGKA